jgi:hypothetical protein
MKKKIFGLFISIFVVAMLVLPMSAVLAAKPTEIVDCSFSVNVLAITQTPVKTLTGKSSITSVDMTGTDCMTWTGDISGVGDYSARWVFHGDMPGGFITHHGLYTIDEATVTIGDVTAVGSVVIKADGNKQHPAGIWRVLSSDLVIEGTEEPISLHGQGEFIMLSPVGPYDVVGQMHFGP